MTSDSEDSGGLERYSKEKRPSKRQKASPNEREQPAVDSASEDAEEQDAINLSIQEFNGAACSKQGGQEADEAPAHKQGATAQRTTKLPVGVVIVESTDEIIRHADIHRLTRHIPRYFEDAAEAPINTFRCFNCGQVGHAARDCQNAARLKPCYLCAQLDHEGNVCPNRPCFRCGSKGHVVRDCPHRNVPVKVCLRCGNGKNVCEAAGMGDYFRYEGGCTQEYSRGDLGYVRCMVCGDVGHLLCKELPRASACVSCYNCGRSGHYGEACPSGLQSHLLAERKGDEQDALLEQYQRQALEQERAQEQQRGGRRGGGHQQQGQSNWQQQQAAPGHQAYGRQPPIMMGMQQPGLFGMPQAQVAYPMAMHNIAYGDSHMQMGQQQQLMMMPQVHLADRAYSRYGQGGGVGGGGGGRRAPSPDAFRRGGARGGLDPRRTNTPRW